jgi:Putative beta-barrel porin-2, OmpL-like. bbp2
MLRKFILTAAAAAVISPLFAQDTTVAKATEEPKPLAISGFVDVYYRYDFSQNTANNRTSFTNSHNSFELGMASIKLEHSFGKVGFVADLGFGKRAQEFSYNESGIVQSIKQLYVTYQAKDWLKLTMGSWATHVGYELVDAPGNRNYSMSYMFSWGPFAHTGLKAEATAGKSGFMLGVANQTDYKTAPLNSKKYLLAQYSYAFSDNVKVYLNYVGGKRFTDSARTNQYDIVLTGKVNDKFSIGYNGTLNSTKFQVNDKYDTDAQTWWGSAVYFNIDPTDKFGITLRSEYFSDKNQLVAMSLAPEGANIFANTLSFNFKAGPLTIVPELRFETANNKVYYDKDGGSVSSNTSALLAAYYKF